MTVYQEIFEVIKARKAAFEAGTAQENSYTAYLFDKGVDKICKKVGEEATETVIAAKNGDNDELMNEINDLLYHVMVLAANQGLTWEEVERVLAERDRQKERTDALEAALAARLADEQAETAGHIVVFAPLLSEPALRELVNRLTDKCGGFAAAFSGSDGEGYRYIIGSRRIDLRKNGRAINAAIRGRGGGTPEMIQGRAAASEAEIRTALGSLTF